MAVHLSGVDYLLIALSILLPPAAVFIIRKWRTDFWINLLLTLFLFVPGSIHAVYILMKYRPTSGSYEEDTSDRSTSIPNSSQQRNSLEKGHDEKKDVSK